ncbi:RDD family protein [Bacillus sp. 1P06AnD]|uniref:RDD family protein n=1 Tax=Bacillus sp. 1P06AnD TaxID=3132208 RepID=UPI0039A3CBF4
MTDKQSAVQHNANYSSFWSRLGSYVVDGLILSAIISVLETIGIFSLMGISFDPAKLSDPNYSMADNSGYMFITLIISILYYSILQSSKWQATVGKKLFNNKVTSVNGERISFLTAVIRHISMIFLSSLMFIGYIMYFFTKKKQTLHDKIAKTVVVKAQ